MRAIGFIWICAAFVVLAGCTAPSGGGGGGPGGASNQNRTRPGNGNANAPANANGNGAANCNDNAPPAEGGRIVYALPDRTFLRIAAHEGADPENLTAALSRLAPAAPDNWVNVSPDGETLLLDTERFDAECAGFSCLALVSGDLSSSETVRAEGQVIHPEGFSAVASGGDLIVFTSQDGPHEVDLWATARRGSDWSAPILLTAASPQPFNTQPAISNDGRRVVFDCGPVPFGQEGTAICEVGTDGAGFRVVLTTADGPPGSPVRGALHHPDYAPDGSIVFEADWNGERIWRLPVGVAVPEQIGDFPNDNSPCVLPDGRVVSLWLNRPGGTGLHEIKVMSADGGDFFVLLTNQDVLDGGIGCGE